MTRRKPCGAISIPATVHRRPIDAFNQRVTFREAFAITEFTASMMFVVASDLRRSSGSPRRVSVRHPISTSIGTFPHAFSAYLLDLDYNANVQVLTESQAAVSQKYV